MKQWTIMAACALTCAAGAVAARTASDAAVGLNWRFRYDDEGRIAAIVDPADRETRVEYTRDANGKRDVVTRHTADGAATRFTYDRHGRRLEMTAAAGGTRYGYDPLGRLTSVRREGAPAISFGYDTLDRLTSLDLGNKLIVRHGYDFLGRLAAIESPAGRIAYEHQSGQRTVVRTLPNGIRTIWEYALDGSLSELSHVDADSRILLQFVYTYRPDGLIGQIVERSSQRGEQLLRYEYDSVQRLTALADSAGGRTEYRYDKLGNRMERVVGGQDVEASAYDWAGRLTRLNGQDCAHDKAGNLAAYPGVAGLRRFAFDAVNRLASARTAAGEIRYAYDGDGNLIGREVDGAMTRFVPDPAAAIWRPLLATGPDGERTFYVWEGDMPLAEVRGENARFFLHDHLGSVRLVLDAAGRIVAHKRYCPFGALEEAPDGNALVPGFTGLFYDARTGLYLTRARGYDPELGRFLQPDPEWRVSFGSQKDLGLYAYCGGDPVNYIDRDGTSPRRADELPPAQPSALELIWTDPARIPGLQLDALRPTPVSPNQNVGFFWTYHRPDLNRLGSTVFTAPISVPGPGMGSLGAHGVARYPVNYGIRPSSAAVGALAVAEHLLSGPRLLYGTEARVQEQVFAQMQAIANTAYNRWAINQRAGVDNWDEIPMVNVSILYNQRTGDLNVWESSHNEENLYDRSSSRLIGASVHLQPERTKTVHHPTRGSVGSGGSPGSGGGGSALQPSTVGGVYLRGAGEALAGLGELRGVALDEKSGRLVLLAEDSDNRVALPPLRLDDLVTVFRSVYLHGEGPSVTIDPNPEDPEKSAMIIRHGKATENTYVGWVLYQADRLMKGYGQGVDNITTKDIESQVEGYPEVLETIYFGGEDPRKAQRGGIWERYWIVPAEVRRFEGPRRELTLFDVPLKLRTQKMKWDGGQLVDDLFGKSSPGALAFTSWFTKHYDAIAAEQYLTPPPASGITNPVPVFAELRRVALMTAIAKKLRDQGVPMPFWMSEHTVAEVPFERFTPGLEVTRRRTVGNTIHTARIFGGVALTADSQAIKSYAAPADVRQAPQETRVQLQRDLKLAEQLERTVAEVRPADVVAPLTLRQATYENRDYKAVALPGADTRALGACRLTESDLTVPVQRGARIELARHFHSFFQPEDAFGKGWTLNLPRLVSRPRPLEQTDQGRRYRTEYLLTDPLDGLNVVFDRQRRVPEWNAELLVPSDEGEILGLTGMNDERIGFETKVVLFHDGRQWHFDEDGRLAARIQAPLAVIHRRDADHRVQRIEGWYGKDLRADIRLIHDAQGRIVEAKGSNGAEVRYAYDAGNRLAQTTAQDTESGYEYADGLVTAVLRNGRPARQFTYDTHGRMLTERNADGVDIAYRVSAESDRVTIQSVASGTDTAVETATYDSGFRPLSRELPDGRKVLWQYDAQGTTETVATPAGESYSMRRSADGRATTWQLPDGPTVAAERDPVGRPLALAVDGRTVARNEWRQDGQLAVTTLETTAIRPQYREDGVMTGILRVPPEEQGTRLSRWHQTDFDELGRMNQVTDHTGLDLRIGYDQHGEPRVWGKPTDDGTLEGVQVERDDAGRIAQVNTSWGYREEHRYNKAGGEIERSEFRQGDATAFVEYDRGRVVKARQFDGGETRVTYHADGHAKDLPRTVTAPNDLVIAYDYDNDRRLTEVVAGDTYKLHLDYDREGRLVGLGMEQ